MKIIIIVTFIIIFVSVLTVMFSIYTYKTCTMDSESFESNIKLNNI
jgi:hypothetical protein